MGRPIEYKRFGFDYVAGRKVSHVQAPGRMRTQCGLYTLGLKVSGNGHVCKNCQRTVKVIDQFGEKIAIFKKSDGVVVARVQDPKEV